MILFSAATLLEHLDDGANAYFYVTKFSTIPRYLPKLYVTKSFAIMSSVTYSEIRQFFFDGVASRHGKHPAGQGSGGGGGVKKLPKLSLKWVQRLGAFVYTMYITYVPGIAEF